jgi:hypothetical protein
LQALQLQGDGATSPADQAPAREDALKQEVSMKKLAALIAIAAAVGLAPRSAAAQSLVTCESTNNNRALCRVDATGGVTIRRQLSSMDCVQGRTWGYTRSAIWVSNGCRAQFLVNSNGRNTNGRYDNDNDNRYGNGGYNANTAAVACRRAVRAQVGRRAEVSTWAINNSRNNARIGWRLTNGRSGECRIDRTGNVSVQVNRNR